MDSQEFEAWLLRFQRIQGALYEDIARLLGTSKEKAAQKVQEAAQPLLDSPRLMSRLGEFFTYTDDITEHEILCHETCEESYDTYTEKDRGGRPSIAYLVKTAEAHVCGDGKWKKD